MNGCMAAVMEAAKSCPDIMLVARYVQDGRALSLYCEKELEDPNVMLFRQLKEGRVKFLLRCLEEVVGRCTVEAAKQGRDIVDRAYWRHSL